MIYVPAQSQPAARSASAFGSVDLALVPYVKF
jgi:hypothetical protein